MPSSPLQKKIRTSAARPGWRQRALRWRARVDDFEERRATPSRTAVSLLVALAAAIVFLLLAQEVTAGRTTKLDEALSLWLHGYDAPWLDRVMFAMTRIGSYWTVVPMTALVAAWTMSRRRWRTALVLVASVVSAMLLTTTAKLLFQRARPSLFEKTMLPPSFSFPSGHALVSMASYGTMALVVAHLAPRWRLPVHAAAFPMIVLIGVSRVYLGVHWTTDIAAGFAAGGIIVLAARHALGEVAREAENVDRAQ